MRKFIEKINNMIQWTKKFHFFHIWLIPGFLFALFPLLLLILTFLTLIFEPSIFDEMGRACGIAFFMFMFYIAIAYFVTFLLGLVYQIILYLSARFFRKDNVHVQSKFLLNNKFYNFIYISSILFNFIFTLYLLFQLQY